jgi:acetyltransferase-like isoleucine patch superfamily enzyme
MQKIINLFVSVLPWFLKRPMLTSFYGYDIHPRARIGLSYVFPEKMKLGDNSRIGSFNIIKNLENLVLGSESIISNFNWISAHPAQSDSFSHNDRLAELSVGKHSAITMWHRFDCTDSIRIGDFTTIAGYRSLFLTHSLNVVDCVQDCKPINIGDYCFLGTNIVMLGGSRVPSYSVVGAMALINKSLESPYSLYAGVPVKRIRAFDPSAKYFTRTVGRIV